MQLGVLVLGLLGSSPSPPSVAQASYTSSSSSSSSSPHARWPHSDPPKKSAKAEDNLRHSNPLPPPIDESHVRPGGTKSRLSTQQHTQPHAQHPIERSDPLPAPPPHSHSHPHASGARATPVQNIEESPAGAAPLPRSGHSAAHGYTNARKMLSPNHSDMHPSVWREEGNDSATELGQRNSKAERFDISSGRSHGISGKRGSGGSGREEGGEEGVGGQRQRGMERHDPAQISRDRGSHQDRDHSHRSDGVTRSEAVKDEAGMINMDQDCTTEARVRNFEELRRKKLQELESRAAVSRTCINSYILGPFLISCCA